MIKNNIIWIVLLAAGVAMFFFLKKNNGANVSAGSSTDIIAKTLYDQATSVGMKIVGYNPPPGYSGPSNTGPFQWGGVGDPPDGVWYTKGNPVYGK
jgi:hypothetical protein